MLAQDHHFSKAKHTFIETSCAFLFIFDTIIQSDKQSIDSIKKEHMQFACFSIQFTSIGQKNSKNNDIILIKAVTLTNK